MAPVSFPVLGFSVLALAAAGSSPAASAEPSASYAGKQITIIVGLPPGGGADAYARLLQRHLGRHIAGNPNILVQNMPGAGSLRAVMYLNTTAPADGTVMATFNPGLITEAVTAPERVRMDFRDFRWIGNVSEDVRVCYVWGASGVKTWQDMTRREKPLFMGASAPGSFGDADVGMLQNLFGVKIRQEIGRAHV